MRVDWLTEITGREYAYLTAGRTAALIVRDPEGDTLLPPYPGRYTALEAVASREDALDAARAWEAAR